LKVSALISAFNSKLFLEGCIHNLIDQSLFKKNLLELIIIDGGSSDFDHELVKFFTSNYSNIISLTNTTKETLYESWNRGLDIATGEYMTNANTDDRHDRRCLEILAQELDDKTDVDLAYGNLYKSLKSNEKFVENDKCIPCQSQQFFPSSLLLHDYIGAQPMWRKSVHDKIGFFDDQFEVVGDYEFVLRAVCKGCKFSYVPEAQGLMLWHQNALSTRDSNAHSEKLELLKFYRSPEQIRKIHRPYFSGYSILQKAYNDLGIRSLCYYPQFNTGNPLFDFSFAEECFSQYSDQISQINLKSLHDILHPQSNVESTKKENLFFYSYSEKLPAEYELKGVEPIYIRKFGDENIQDKFYQKYSFDLSKFYQFFFGHLDIESISNADCVYIWGYNERGKTLAKYLESSGLKNVRIIDSNTQTFTKNLQSRKNLPIRFEDIKDTENVVFILTMSSHHWSTVRTEIEKKLPGSRVLTFDKA
jgi:GT2 family glycosyltransferase